MRCILLTSRQWQFFKDIQVLKRFSPQSDAPKFSAGPAENFGAVLGVLINTILRPNIHDWNILRTYFYKYLFIQSHYQPISIHPTNISIFPLRAVKLKTPWPGVLPGATPREVTEQAIPVNISHLISVGIILLPLVHAPIWASFELKQMSWWQTLSFILPQKYKIFGDMAESIV